MTKVSIEEINKAAERLEDVSNITPLIKNKRLSEKYDANIYLKREDLQEVRSFKIRGAYNKIRTLKNGDIKNGVVCASAGNHAQGVAYSCNELKIKGVIFMPTVTPNQKLNKVKKFGGEYVEVKMIGDNFDEAKELSVKYCEENDMTYVHPYDDELVIAGQGTIAKEIYEKLDSKLDYAFVAVGGGGLISGVGSYLKGMNDEIKVIGVESATQASMYESLKNGKLSTLDKIDSFCDGTAVKTPGEITFEIAKEVVDQVVLGEDGQVATDMIDLYQSEGIVTEPAGALAISGLEKLKDEIKGKNVVLIICGGNNDILRYPEIQERSLVYKGLKHYFVINFAQKAGQLKRFLNEAMGPDDDIARFEYIKKTNKDTGPALVGVELAKKEDYKELITRMSEIGLDYRVLTKDDMLYSYLV